MNIQKIYFCLICFLIILSLHANAQCNFNGTLSYDYDCSNGTNIVWLRNCDAPFPYSASVKITKSDGVQYNGGVETPGACQMIKFSNVAQGFYTLNINGTVCTNYTIDVPAPPAAPTIQISANHSPFLCQGEQITLTASGGTSYQWYMKDSQGILRPPQYIVSGSSTSNSITVAPPSDTRYVVQGTLSCGGSQYSSEFPTFITPSVGPVTISGINIKCQGSGQTQFTANASNAINYTWSVFPTNAVESISGGLVTWKADYAGPSVDITVVATGCNTQSSSTTKTVTIVLPVRQTNIWSTPSICFNETGEVVLLDEPEPGVSYQLYQDNNPSGYPKTNNDSQGTHLKWTGLFPGTYKITGTKTGCPAADMLNESTIQRKSPNLISYSSTSSPMLHCAGDSITFIAAGGYNYHWTSSKGESWSTGTITVNPAESTTYTLTGTESACGTNQTSYPFNANVVAKPQPPPKSE